MIKGFKEFLAEDSIEDSVAKHRAKKDAERHLSLDQHIHNALRAPYEHNGKVYKGNTLDGIHEYMRNDTHHPHMSKRALEDHLHSHRDIHHLDGHSRLGWTRGGQTKRSKARFFTKKELHGDQYGNKTEGMKITDTPIHRDNKVTVKRHNEKDGMGRDHISYVIDRPMDKNDPVAGVKRTVALTKLGAKVASMRARFNNE